MNNKKENLIALYRKFINFKESKLYIDGAENIVFGEGNVNSKIMFIGEAPGKIEELTGSPFVGKSGIFFEKIINDFGILKNYIFITNIVKCRPPKNRRPTSLEIKNGRELILKHEIEIIKPELIVTLGLSPLNGLVQEIKSISNFRGKVLNSIYGKIFPIFHPSYAMTSLKGKEIFKNDIKNIINFIFN